MERRIHFNHYLCDSSNGSCLNSSQIFTWNSLFF